MFRLVLALILASALFAQNSSKQSLETAAESPYDLAKYINSHDEIQWGALWRVLGIDAPPGMECFRDCAAEIIAVDGPNHVILVVSATVTRDVYLRFKTEETGRWRLTGSYLADVSRAKPHRHSIVRAGNRQFLVVSTQGGYGSGLDEDLEDWLDLTETGLVPAYAHVVNLVEDRMFGHTISMHGDAAAIGDEITERIHIQLTSPGCSLVDLMLEAQFKQLPGAKYSFQTAKFERGASIQLSEFQGLVGAGRAPDEQLIKYSLPRMTQIASTGTPAQKACLSEYLSHAKPTQQRDELLRRLQ